MGRVGLHWRQRTSPVVYPQWVACTVSYHVWHRQRIIPQNVVHLAKYKPRYGVTWLEHLSRKRKDILAKFTTLPMIRDHVMTWWHSTERTNCSCLVYGKISLIYTHISKFIIVLRILVLLFLHFNELKYQIFIFNIYLNIISKYFIDKNIKINKYWYVDTTISLKIFL